MCLRLLSLLLGCVLTFPSLAQDQNTSTNSTWYRGQGAQFEVLISGQVTEDGKHLNADVDVELELARNERLFWSQVVRTQSGRYQAWLPVGAHPGWHSIAASAHNANGAAGRAFATAGKLPSAIREGLNLNLAKPTRTLSVKVTHQGQPVPKAHVRFRAIQGEETLETDAQGIAHPQVCGETSFIQLFAWTDAKQISPQIYRRSGTSEFDSNDLALELFACKSTAFIVKDQQGKAAAHVPLIIVSDRQLAGDEEQSFRFPPNVNFVSDADGKLVNDWLPDLPDLKINFGLSTKDWTQESIDTSTTPITLMVKRAKQRVRIEGKVVAEPGVEVAGLFVKLTSFQAEQESIIEEASAIVDSAGNFAVDVLPGATYAACINDANIVSEFQKVYVDPTAATQPKLNLKAVPGVPVVVQVTQGNSSQPLAGARVFAYSDFDISWVDNARQRGGSLTRSTDSFTNELGQATVYTLPGKTKVSVMYGDWHADLRRDVKASDNEPVQFHRKLQGKIRGRVIADGSQVKSLAGTKVVVVSVDNHVPETHRLTTDEKGVFEFESSSTAVWALASTEHEELMGSEKLTDVNQELVIPLSPTNKIAGRLVDAEGQPIANREVEAQVVIENHPYNNLVRTKALQKSTTTDQEGRYTFANLPCKVPISIVVFQQMLGVKQSDLIEHILFRDARDQRPELKSVLSDTVARDSTTLAQRYENLLKDCRLNNYRLLVVIANKTDVNEKFLNTRLLDDGELPVMRAYMPLWLTAKELSDPAAQKFGQQHQWPVASDHDVFVSILDGSGQELGRITADVREASDAERIIALVKAHAPVPSNAQAAWKAAFAEAKSSHRRVWARVGGRYCGHCFTLTEWIDTHKAILEKEFVLFKVDCSNDLNAEPIANQIMQGKSAGFPFHAIFSADGQMLTDSEGPFGNIGSIGSNLESLRHFRQMLETGCLHLSQAEITELLKSLE